MWYFMAGVLPTLVALGFALVHGALALEGSSKHATRAIVWTVIAVAFGASGLVLALMEWI
jgi:hypothetical protein